MTNFVSRINNYLDKPARTLALLLVLGIGVLIACLSYYNEISEGGGDVYWHYYFSKYAYSHPKFFLHHWGKPFFIFLSAPFSHFGYYALNLFNICCGLGSAYIAYLWCKKLGFGFSYVAIILVLFTPVYFLVIQSSLTEPLFSLLLILSAYLLFSEKYLAGAIVASFLMYSRTEGTFIILILAFYVCLVRQWKYLPFFATAFVIYSFIGLFSGHDFLWFFTENPYAEDSVYGHGTWSHFFDKNEYIFGTDFVRLLALGFFLLLRAIVLNKEYLFWKKAGPHFKVFCLAFVPALAYYFFHVYAWAMGKYASAGLERIIAGIVPLGVIVCMYTFHLIYTLKFSVLRYAIVVFTLVSFVKLTFLHYNYPLSAFGGEKAEIAAAKWFKTYRQENSIIYYAHPGLVFYCDYEPFAPENRECMVFKGACGADAGKKVYYFWDSQFTKSACGESVEDLEKCPSLVKVKEFEELDFKLVVFESK